MIDAHVHLRDFEESRKETVYHGLKVAFDAGLDAVFEMPNTKSALTSSEMIEKRIRLGDYVIGKLKQEIKGFEMFHGIYGGITSDKGQIEDIVNAYNQFQRVIGLKMFAGQSTGNMGLVDDEISTGEEKQRLVYETLVDLGYEGVLAVHCEKESLMHQDIWDPNNPISHSYARPNIVEIRSIEDQIRFAYNAGFKGTLHICHVSTKEGIEIIEEARKNPDYLFNITCGITPHHAMMNISHLLHPEKGLLRKMNPPLRPEDNQKYILGRIIEGSLNDFAIIESDHAPHTLEEKHGEHLSGIPGLPFYPVFIRKIKEMGATDETIEMLTHSNINTFFKTDIKDSNRKPRYDLSSEYEFDVFPLIHLL